MPTVTNIKKAMRKTGISKDVMAQFDFPAPQGNQFDEVLSLIQQMDNLLTNEQCLAVMEEQGCSKTEKISCDFKEFGQKYANKTLEEKVKLLAESGMTHTMPCYINSNGMLSIHWGFEQKGSFRCVCRKINFVYKEQEKQADISKTYCGCCAGHVRHTHQIALGVKLKLVEIVSSPISSGGKKRCEFLFKVVG